MDTKAKGVLFGLGILGAGLLATKLPQWLSEVSLLHNLSNSTMVSASRGRNQGTRPGAGPGGYCVCPACGNMVPHTTGVACYTIECPLCGSRMVR